MVCLVEENFPTNPSIAEMVESRDWAVHVLDDAANSLQESASVPFN